LWSGVQEKVMKARFLWLTAGVLLGGLGAAFYLGGNREAEASTHDRYQDYIMVTGPASITPTVPMDGVWLLDYRAGKLLGTIIDRSTGRVSGWAEVDLVSEFGLQPRQPDVHFMMTTGNISVGQAALYVAETSTGKFGIYTMGPRPDGQPGVAVRRHDLSFFRKPKGG
jgi:hypothetical protein